MSKQPFSTVGFGDVTQSECLVVLGSKVWQYLFNDKINVVSGAFCSVVEYCDVRANNFLHGIWHNLIEQKLDPSVIVRRSEARRSPGECHGGFSARPRAARLRVVCC